MGVENHAKRFYVCMIGTNEYDRMKRCGNGMVYIYIYVCVYIFTISMNLWKESIALAITGARDNWVNTIKPYL